MSNLFGKKQVVLACLIAALGVAVYLNYYFSTQKPVVDTGGNTSSIGDHLGDSQFVNNPSTVTTQPDPNDYFVQARLNRETARTQALDIIKDMMNDVKATDEVKTQAMEKAAAVAQAIEQEGKIESLIKAKGFADCVVYIEDENCHVVVRSGELATDQRMQILEIITDQSKVVAQNVKIVTVQ